MKKTNLLYWITTGLFSSFMIFSAIPDIMMTPEAVTFITGLGYPEYFIPFIGVAKLIGAIVLLIPGLNRLKEWAYAGLFFDLAGAVYSAIVTGGLTAPLSFMILPVGFLFLSYFLWHRKNKLTTN
ncbi:MAG: DoxX family protein [Chitinophagales bacterium]|nr:DoxX family protein [Chitinophagales bacterium]